MKKAIAFALVIMVVVLSLASCAPSIKGKWTYSTTLLGQDIKVTLNFKSNGELETTTETLVLGVSNKDVQTLKYTFDGKTLIVDGEETKYEIDGNTLKFPFGDLGYIEFKRQ